MVLIDCYLTSSKQYFICIHDEIKDTSWKWKMEYRQAWCRQFTASDYLFVVFIHFLQKRGKKSL